MSDLDEARDLLARWAAGGVSDPDVWAGRGPRLLAGLVAEVERLEEHRDRLLGIVETAGYDPVRLHHRHTEDQHACTKWKLRYDEARGRLLAAEGVIEAARQYVANAYSGPFFCGECGHTSDTDVWDALEEAVEAYVVDAAVRSVVTADQETPE